MRLRDYKDLLVRAANLYADSLKADAVLLNKLAAQLADNERTKEILRSKGYGATGASASESASLVPQLLPVRRHP
ncbi:hypothetical protein AAKU55_005295 [Oxalobacteraceae bacterium GrIS 1.11]